MKTILKMLLTWLSVSAVGAIVGGISETIRTTENGGTTHFTDDYYFFLIMGLVISLPGMFLYHLFAIFFWRTNLKKWQKKLVLSVFSIIVIWASALVLFYDFRAEEMIPLTLEMYIIPFLVCVWCFEYPES